MSEYYEEDFIEPESAYTLKDGKAEVKIQFSAEALERAASEIVQRHIDINFLPKLERAIGKYLELSAHSDLDSLIKETVREEFLKKYPDVVENKVNDIAEHVKKIKMDDLSGWKWNNTSKSISEAAKEKVMNYIKTELDGEIKIQKDYLEQFSRNYFANNLFRAMGMMDKMIPQVSSEGAK